ncbi:ATP-binding protein [Exercitatus varius]|uniref:ATP-binding protein n=1 Tax=Exercitatus varius TaxID=67857 RepID=UPI00294B7F69|nr:ATP-binding protein [Exercitatus varius]MDG2957983.1 ATP-binding protein [Exercitatus varius]
MNKSGIIKTLKNALNMGLLFTCIIGAVSLISWYQQHKQVNYILNDYFPKTNLALKLDDNVNSFINELDRFAAVKNNPTRQTMFKQLNLQLIEIEKNALALTEPDNQIILTQNISDLKSLIGKIDNNISQYFYIEQKKQELFTKIQWLHDDFNNEIVALGQELNWQQINFTEPGERARKTLMLNLQDELQSMTKLKNMEEQIKNEITQFIYSLEKQNISEEYQNLKNIILNIYLNEQKKPNKASLATLQQMVETLVNITKPGEELDLLITNINNHQQSLNNIASHQEKILYATRNLTNKILSKTKDKFSMLNSHLKTQTEISGMIILMSLMIVLLFIWLFNRFYLQKHLTKRFEELIESVKLLNQGKEDPPIQIIGNDEISEINRLLKKHTEILQERRIIQQNLQDTQNELIQTAKLAVVGQTMTMLAHEINQPLNAMSIYLFSLKKMLQQQDYRQVADYTAKITGLTERIGRIVKGLRQFTKRTNQMEPLQPIDLHTVINEAWSLLELRHQPLHAILSVQGNATILGNNLLLEQIFVNLFNNALEACKSRPHISVRITSEQQKTYVYVEDNGIGWQTDNINKLLQPFYSSKEVGLGLGLTICRHIMNQFNGNLYIASSFQQSAVIILEFPPISQEITGNHHEK